MRVALVFEAQDLIFNLFYTGFLYFRLLQRSRRLFAVQPMPSSKKTRTSSSAVRLLANRNPRPPGERRKVSFQLTGNTVNNNSLVELELAIYASYAISLLMAAGLIML